MLVPSLASTGAGAVGAGCTAVLGTSDYQVTSTSSGGGDASLVDASLDAPGPGDDATAPEDASPDAPVVHECEHNADCQTGDAGALLALGADADARSFATPPIVCVKPEYKCVPLVSAECPTVTGTGYTRDDAIVIGSLFSIQGAQQATNVQRQQAAVLAVNEVDQVGGIPAASAGGAARPVVMVSCDTAINATNAATHLAKELHVPAIVGPNTSQDTLNLASAVTIPAGTVTITPSAIAASIVDLVDRNLVWLMVPSDVQRAPLMKQAIADVTAQILASRAVPPADPDNGSVAPAPLKLDIVFRNDALGKGTQTSLNDLTFNGKPLSDPTNLGANVRVDGYDPALTDQSTLVKSIAAFAPDIVVLAGTAEVVTKVLTPLEKALLSTGVRPYYVGVDPMKGPDLLAAVSDPQLSTLRSRVRGVGLPGLDANPVSSAFKADYFAQYGAFPSASGAAASYDATYAIAYAIAALGDTPVTGANLAATGLRALAGGPTAVDVGPGSKITGAFSALARGGKLSVTGTYGPLDWNDKGAPTGGQIAVWCIGTGSGVTYGDSGETYDLKTNKLSGKYTPCP